MDNYRSVLLGVLAMLLVPASAAWAQSGKIAGQVTDAESGEPLPGVNVVIEGRQIGATTDANGQYSIVGVPAGTYTVRASFVGYADQVIRGVDVNIDLTTTQNFQLQEETQQLQEVTVEATERVVKPDISANVANLDSEDMEAIPVTSVGDVVGLQAGVQGMSIRGGGADEVAFIVDGMNMRDGRDNQPYTGVSYTSVKEVQVQTGGFNAEYGNLRSGLVNVVTLQPPQDRYLVDALVKYSSPSQEAFGIRPDNVNAYWMRPYLDDEVAFEGTGNWDTYTQMQYPSFKGWNAVSEEMQNNDEEPNLTPEQAQEVFKWLHRRDFEITKSDHTVDATIGGPIPGGSYLGDLRFLASYRQHQDPYIVPKTPREAYTNRMGQLKLVSNITSGARLQLQGMLSEEEGFNPTSHGGPSMLKGGGGMANRFQCGGACQGGGAVMYGDGIFNPMDVTRYLVGGEFTHTLSAETFYKFRLQRMYSDYWTRPMRERSNETVKTIGGMELNEAPFGWKQGFDKIFRLMIGSSWGTARDTSETTVWKSSFDLTSQITPYSQLKVGGDFIYSSYNARYGLVRTVATHWSQPRFIYDRQTQQGAFYAQDKLEFEGLVANLGVRLDYFAPGGNWYTWEPFTRALAGKNKADRIDKNLDQVTIDPQFNLSPRLGVSFPVTTNSKLFFNYGHFRQMLDPNAIFLVRENRLGTVDAVANPSHPLPKTVAYELGYEQNLFDQYLVRLNGYYKDVKFQQRNIGFESIDGLVDYTTPMPNNYEDIRGAEISIRKRQGRWVQGFANFSFMVRKQGDFGLGQYFENPVRQRQYERNNRNFQWKPVPQPFARVNLSIHTPQEFGPEVLGHRIIGDWYFNWLASWRAGNVFTWTGGGGQVPGLRNNVRETPFYNVDLRVSKTFDADFGSFEFFADVSNVFNIRRLNMSSFQGGNDYQEYMKSLHLPEETFSALESDPYPFIPGNDQPGDYKDPDAEWVPIEIVPNISEVSNPHQRPLYYDQSSKDYMVWKDGSWSSASENRVDQVLEDKAYINMPNLRSFRFLDPRDIHFGLRVQF